MTNFEKIYFICVQILTVLVLSNKYIGLFYKQYAYIILYIISCIILDIYYFRK